MLLPISLYFHEEESNTFNPQSLVLLRRMLLYLIVDASVCYCRPSQRGTGFRTLDLHPACWRVNHLEPRLNQSNPMSTEISNKVCFRFGSVLRDS